MFIFLCFIFTTWTSNIITGIIIAFICHNFINWVRGTNNSINYNSYSKNNKGIKNIAVNFTDDLTDVLLHQAPKKPGSKIPQNNSTISVRKKYQKPIFYGQGTEIKIDSYTIKDPFMFYTEYFIKEDNLSNVAIYGIIPKMNSSDFITYYSSRDPYYRMAPSMRKEFLKWLAHDRYKIPTFENEWCAFYYIKNIRTQILIQPNKDLLDELLQVYKVYCYRRDYSNVLSYIITSIESLCYILLLELSDPEIDNILNTLVMDSEYTIQNDVLIENDKKIVKNHVTRNTYHIVSKLLLYFNKSKIANTSDLAPLVMKLLPPELKKDAKVQKQSIFQTYLNLTLNKYKVEDIFQIAIPTTNEYFSVEHISLPTLMITDLISILYQDVKRYINSTESSQIERFLFLPLQLKLHFGFSKKKNVDKLYKKTKFKIASLQEFWKDLGYSDLNLTEERLKQMFEIYYCMGYMYIYSNNKIALIYKSQYDIDSLFSQNNFLLSLSQIAAILINELAKLENVQFTVLNYIKDKFNLSEVQLEYVYHGMLLPYTQLKFNKEFYDEVLVTEYIHFISYIQQDFKTNKEKYISIYKLLGYKNIENFISMCSDQELLANKFEYLYKIEPTVVSNRKLNLDLDKIQALQESTKRAHSLLHNVLGEEESIDEEFVQINTNQQNYTIDIPKIISKLITKEFWNKTELIELFKPTKIMLNAGIEKINEYSEEQYGDILIIDNNTNYEINKDILEEHF